jgi:hypothetical protein
VAPLALKAIVAVIASKAGHPRRALKAAVKAVPKVALNPVANSAENNPVVLHPAEAKAASNHVAINDKMHVLTIAVIHVVTASTHATAAPHARLPVTVLEAVQAIVSHVALRSLALATSNLTMLADMPHPSALALKY